MANRGGQLHGGQLMSARAGSAEAAGQEDDWSLRRADCAWRKCLNTKKVIADTTFRQQSNPHSSSYFLSKPLD
ncbi:MAG: hypothetical protein EBW14_20695 [Oxalobacteraceae bacterium]|nr:hypothetical protein [Oxalobacteraceae bacterium]